MSSQMSLAATKEVSPMMMCGVKHAMTRTHGNTVKRQMRTCGCLRTFCSPAFSAHTKPRFMWSGVDTGDLLVVCV